MVRISDTLEIPEGELSFRYARSSGPGGQNVNKVATKVTVLFDVAASSALTDDQKARIAQALSGRISKDGLLHVTSERHRTRSANQRDAIDRFTELVASALRPRKRRRATRVPESSRRHRLVTKRRHSDKKRLRRHPPIDD